MMHWTLDELRSGAVLATYEELGSQMIKEITVLTTFHQPGLEKYGQRLLDSFAKRVDNRIKLLVYAEDCKPINPNPEQITILDAIEVLPKLNAFKVNWSRRPKANGIPPDDIKARRPRDHHKTFKWDAIRFANKTYAVYDACTRSKDWCVWMDADTFVHSDWSYDDFHKTSTKRQMDYIRRQRQRISHLARVRVLWNEFT